MGRNGLRNVTKEEEPNGVAISKVPTGLQTFNLSANHVLVGIRPDQANTHWKAVEIVGVWPTGNKGVFNPM